MPFVCNGGGEGHLLHFLHSLLCSTEELRATFKEYSHRVTQAGDRIKRSGSLDVDVLSLFIWSHREVTALFKEQ